MRGGVAILVAASLSTLLVRAQAPTPAPAPTPQLNQPVFRGGTDVVSVNVSVRAGGAPVANLQASDFVVLDNGVRQRIESVELEAVPADVTLLVETSEAVAGSIGSLSDQVQKMAALVRPLDRLSIITIDTYVNEVLPMQPVLNPQLDKLIGGGRSSANDALASALLRHADPDRPHLIIAMTNDIDTMSTLDMSAVRELARESAGVLHVALVDLAEEFPGPYLRSSQQRLNEFRCGTSRQCSLTHLFWRANDDRPFGIFHLEDFGPLREAAEITGGTLYLPGVFTDRSVAGIFNKVFADYRKGYVLRYTPQGTKREGWHELSVTVPAQPSYILHARRGYAIDVPQPSPSASPAPAAEPALAAVIASYAAGNYGGAMRALRAAPDRAKALRDFRVGGNPWPGDPRREAVFALELAETGLVAHRDDAQQAAWELLKTFRKLVRRPIAPDEFERSWLWTEIAMLEGALQANAAESAVDNALARFPEEPRFILARAVVADQRALLGLTPNPFSSTMDVGIAYDAAIAHAETATEARIRKAWYLHRRGQHREAIALLDAATGPSTENGLGYLRELFRGHALTSLGQSAEAITAYRAAHAISPASQSATVALMDALYTHGDRREAEALSEAIQTATRDAADPWWAFWQGDYRFYPAIVGRLRAALQ